MTWRRMGLLTLLVLSFVMVGAAEGEVTQFSYEDPVFITNATTINVTVENNGTATVQGSVNVSVSFNGTVVERFEKTGKLDPEGELTLTGSFTPQEKGDYTILLEALIGDERLNRTAEFRVGGYNYSIAMFDFDQIEILGNTTNITVKLANTGVVPVRSKFRVEVYNINSTRVYTYYQPEEVIQPGENRTEYITHVAHRNGTFFLRLRAVIHGEVLLDALTLRVFPEPEQPDLPPVTIIRRKVVFQRPDVQEEEFKIRRWRINAPRRVTIEENGTITFPLTIRSTGEGTVENVMLRASATGNLTVEHSPNILFNIPPNETRNFIMKLHADVGQREGLINYQLNARRLSAQGTIGVEITPDVTVEQLRNRLEDLRFLLERARAEIRAAEQAGLNVSQARDRLQDARAELRDAEAALNRSSIPATKVAINDAQQAVSASFSALYEARSRRVQQDLTPVDPMYLLGVVALVGGSLLVGWYYRLKHRFNRRPKLLREAE
ncbi:MAG: CARDB domain-containing protein [Candidatus Nanohaloarchaea archaeon]|nr:CARDB domain-containing protein [Candidatus Nanohaloarchaea archaeon]